MGAIEEIYADLDTDVPEEEFRETVEEKVEEMGGLADEETAAMLIAHELTDENIEGIADIEPGMDEAKFAAKVISIGDLRTFDRDGEDSEGKVINVEVADETGWIRVAFWDEQAESATEELESGDVLKISGRPQEGYNGTEVSVDHAEPADMDIEVELDGPSTIEALSMGQSDVTLTGVVLDTDSIRSFERDDGSEGRVSNLTLGDETGRIRLTLWDDQTEHVNEVTPGTTVELVDGYVRERNGDLEVHLSARSTLKEVDAEVEYDPETTPIGEVEIETTVDIGGVIRSADPKRTFERDDGSDGQVRNVRVQDDSGDIRVALWGEKADRELGPGDEVLFTDVEIQDGWQDDLEASAGWQASVMNFDAGPSQPAADREDTEESTGLGSFAGDANAESAGESETDNGDETDGNAGETDDADNANEEGPIEFTGTVVQAGNPVVLDNGTETMRVETDMDVHLGQEITARGAVSEGQLDAEEVF